MAWYWSDLKAQICPRKRAPAVNYTLQCTPRSFMHSFTVVSENMTVNHILPKARLFGLHFCPRQYGSNFNFNQFDVVGPKQNSVIQCHRFWYQRKPICYFLLVNNSELHPNSQQVQDIVDDSSNFHCRQRVPLFNALNRG